ncbi:MAG: hypothetical protein ACJAUP_001069 [Cellvibrionaceae bacterium]|jgi:hypothetical protein
MFFVGDVSSILTVASSGVSVAEAVFGVPQDAALEAALTDIDNQLTDLQNSIDELAVQLNIDTQEVESYIQEIGIENAITSIQEHYNNTPITGLPWFCSTATNGDGIDAPPASTSDIETYVNNTFGSWDINTQVNSVSDALLDNNVGTNIGLLETWNNLFISMMGTNGNNPNLFNFYLTFEGYYLQQLNNLVSGMQILMNCYGYDDQLNGTSNSQSYYTNNFTPIIESQLELYTSCIESMVVSQFDMALDNGNLTFPSDGLKTLNRADIFVGMVRQNFDNPPLPGLVARVLCTSGDIVNGVGPSLEPSYGSMVASTGVVASGPTAYIAPCWDEAGAPYHTLKGVADSKIQIVRYRWVWPDSPPQAGLPITVASGVTATPQYYDLSTQEIVAAPGENIVLFAGCVDLSKFITKIVGSGGWSNSAVVVNGSNDFVGYNDSAPDGSTTGPVSAELNTYLTSEGIGTKEGSYTYTIQRDLAYDGSGPTEIDGEIDATLSLQGSAPYNPYSPSELLFTPEMTITCAQDPNFKYASSTGGIVLPTTASGDNNGISTASLQNQSIKFSAPMTLSGSDARLFFNLIMTLEGANFRSDQAANVSLTVNNTSFSYPLTPVVAS